MSNRTRMSDKRCAKPGLGCASYFPGSMSTLIPAMLLSARLVMLRKSAGQENRVNREPPARFKNSKYWVGCERQFQCEGSAQHFFPSNRLLPTTYRGAWCPEGISR